MRSIWNGTLVVGQVSIPVGLGIAASREGSGFRLLHRVCGTPVGQVRRCETCKVELRSNEEIVSGYEFATGQYAVFETGELEGALQAKQLKLDRFLGPGEVPPEYVDRSHWLIPAKDRYAESAYAVLREALEKTKLAGVGQIVLTTKELPCLVSSHLDEQVLMLQTLFTAAQVRRPTDVWKRTFAAEISEEMIGLAVQAVQSRRAFSFKPGRLERWFPKKLPAIVKAKAEGGKVAVPQPHAAAPRDLEAALRKSLKRVRKVKA